MQFTIAVHSPPHASTANHHALSFCRAAVAAGHTITRVFFYHEGVYTALSSQVSPQGETDYLGQWQVFAQQHALELAVCIANGLKRGVISQDESARYDKSVATLADGFTLVGLGQLIDAIASSERYVEFVA